MNKLKRWFSNLWKGVKNASSKTAITITEEIQKGLKSGKINTVAQIIQTALPAAGRLPEQVVKSLEVVIPKVLAVQLVLRDLPDNPTIDDLQKFSDNVLTAFGAVDDKSRLWTTMAAEIYKSIQSHLEDKKYTFAECVIDVEKAWRLYQAEIKKP